MSSGRCARPRSPRRPPRRTPAKAPPPAAGTSLLEIVDRGVVLAVAPHGETHAVAQIFAARHGRRAGLVHGGQGRRMRPVLQPGNGVEFVWRGRGDALGHFALELTAARAAAALADPFALAGLAAAAAVAAESLPEREPHPGAFAALEVLLDALGDPDLWPALAARWEVGLIAELGFGLALDRCAATGARDDLRYVSPRSGGAVGGAAGAPYADRLFRLPPFLGGAGDPTPEDAADALAMTAHFLEARVFHPNGRPLPEPRRRLMEMLRARADRG